LKWHLINQQEGHGLVPKTRNSLFSSDKKVQNNHDNKPYLHRIISKIQHPEANNKDKCCPRSSALEFTAAP
jgi:hypothetical protein